MKKKLSVFFNTISSKPCKSNLSTKYSQLFGTLLFLLLGFFLCPITYVKAQDVHYTQFYTDALRLNPAMTGNFSADYRIGVNFKNQWQTVPAPYRTASIYADFVPIKHISRNGGQQWIGTGLNLLYDYAGDGRLSMLEVRGNVAAHTTISPQLYLSLGLDAAFRQRSIDYSKLYFSNQWDEIGFDPSLVGENLPRDQFAYLDLAGGLNISYQLPDICNIYLGMSALHINQPIETFLTSENRLGTRLAFNLGGSIKLNRFNIEPAIYLSTQKKATELMLGSNFVFAAAPPAAHKTRNNASTAADMRFYAGIWYRLNDAIAPLVGIDLKRYRLLISYDVNISSLKPASQNRGGLEVSLVHVGNFKRKIKTAVYCPRF